jgi:hypothetical protein
MKTICLKRQWLAPLLGVAVVGGGLMATRTYFELEHKVRAHEALTATLERLYQDQKLSTALKSLHDGDVQGAAQRLDVVLCESILRLNDELASADARTRMYIEDAFRRIALARSGIAGGEAAGPGQGYTDDQAAVERILRRALGNTHTAQVR